MNRKNKRIQNLIGALVVLLFLLGSLGCSSDTVAPGDDCQKSSDCAEGLFCLDGVCLASCTSDAGCPEGQTCEAGACRDCPTEGCEEVEPLANGENCGAGNACESGFCVDGVCCENACEDTCTTCNGNQPGTCEGLGTPGCISGSILVRVDGYPGDVRVSISGPEDYDRTTSGGEAAVNDAPGGTYTVGCEAVAQHSVVVGTQDDTIDTQGEEIEFVCVYSEVPITGTVTVQVTGIERDVGVTVEGESIVTDQTQDLSLVLEDMPAGTYSVHCEDLGAWALEVDPVDDVLDEHGETLTFTCTYDFAAHWFVAGFQGTLLASRDGESWSAIEGVPETDWAGIAHGNGLTMLVGGTGVAVSADGLNWTGRNAPAGATYLRGVAFGGGKFVVIDAEGRVYSTADGTMWDAGTVPQPFCQLFDVSYGDGRFLAVGGHGGLDCTLISDDGATWTDTSPATATRQNAVAYADGPMGYFLTVGMYGSGIWSFDGGDAWEWNDVSQGNQSRMGIAYGDDRFVMVGDDAITLVDKGNPANWTDVSDPVVAGNDLVAVAYGDGAFVVVGYMGAIFRSDSGGETWENSGDTGTYQLLQDVLYVP